MVAAEAARGVEADRPAERFLFAVEREAGDLAQHAGAGEALVEVERGRGAQVDDAGDAVGILGGARRLVGDDAADREGREEVERDRAVVARGLRQAQAVEGVGVVAGVEAADRHELRFAGRALVAALVAADRDAGQHLGEVGDAGLRMDRHVAGGNDVDRGDRLLILVQRGALATAVDDDIVGQRFAGGLLRFFRRGQRGRVLRKGGGGQQRAQRQRGDAAGQDKRMGAPPACRQRRDRRHGNSPWDMLDGAGLFPVRRRPYAADVYNL